MERPPLRSSLLVALFVAITWGACTFAVAGLLAVLLDRDPISTPAPTWAGLVGIALAGIVVWLAVGVGVRAATAWPAVVAAVTGVYLVALAAALLGSFALFAEQATSPFVIAGALLAGLAVVLTRLMMRRPPNAGLFPGGGRS
jgi:hypothetical protein